MPNTKQWKYSQRLLALHEEWAVKNGYRDKPQATSERRSDGNQTPKLLQETKTAAQSCKRPAKRGEL
tara:strand:+ start:560 stop:760 length:201 start_codon:yes stop_codon:yes gene_type:complete